jgi:two-component system nitrogen regulation response regulator NtrX
MISGHGNIETAVKTIKLGAYDFIEKPFKTDRLLLMIERALEAASLRRENEVLKQETGRTSNFVGNSDAIKNLQSVLDKLGQTNSRILISGERGTGKSIAARYIHSKSLRSDGPFQRISCAMEDKEQLKRLMFGAEKNGNVSEGVWEQCHNGTILLDDVSELTTEIQGLLVKVLHEGKITREGGSEAIECDVRIVATTNTDLEELIKAQKFREDLYYRLNVASVSLPTLNERLQDVPDFVSYFANRYAQEHGLKTSVFNDCCLAALQTYDWPGNIRQLRNVVEWLIIMFSSNHDSITADMLPSDLIKGRTSNPAISDQQLTKTSNGINMSDFATLSLREAREQFECEYLRSQINRFGGNISKTAEFIGMERSALHRKLRQLGLSAVQKSEDQNVSEQVSVA